MAKCKDMTKPEEEGYPEEPLPMTVAVRLKPNPNNEPIALQGDPAKGAVSFLQSPPGYSAGEKPDTAQFNYVFTESSSQEAVYSQLLSQFVPLILDGYDLTVLCAGQSGSGKSHSLFGAGLPLAMNEEDFGMTMRVARDVFQSVQDMKQPDLRLQVMVSFYNVMEDCVWDLLSHSGDKLTQIRDRMDKSGRVIKSEIVGLTEVECFSANDVSTCLESGQSINLTKSLGDLQYPEGHHSVFSIRVRLTRFDRLVSLYRTSDAVVRFVELVGSEKVSNHGLLALNIMSDPQKNPRHDMTLLTRLLRDALKGRTIAVLFSCLSTLQKDLNYSEDSIQFAKSLSRIVNQPLPNVTTSQMNSITSAQNGDRRSSNDLGQVALNLPSVLSDQSFFHHEVPKANGVSYQNHFQTIPMHPTQGQIPLGVPMPSQQQASNLVHPGLLTAHVSPGGLMSSPAAGDGLGNALYNFYYQKFYNEIMRSNLLNQSPLTLSPMQQQQSSPLIPQQPTGQVPLFVEPPSNPTEQDARLLMDPAKMPLNLSEKDLEKPEDRVDHHRPRPKETRPQPRQKLECIAEETETSGTVKTFSQVLIEESQDSAMINTSASADGEKIEEDLEQDINDEDDDEFDSDCSDVSIENDEAVHDVLDETLTTFEAETRALIAKFQDSIDLDDIAVTENVSDQFSRLAVTKKEIEGAEVSKSLGSDVTKVALLKDRLIAEQRREIQSLSLQLQRSQQESDIKDESHYREGCSKLRLISDLLREEQSALLEQKLLITMRCNELHCVPESELVKQEIKDLSKTLVTLSVKVSQLAELILFIDKTMELKWSLYQTGAIRFEEEWPGLQDRMEKIIRGLSKVECQAHVSRLLGRVVDLCVSGEQKNLDLDERERKYERLLKAYQDVRHKLSIQKRKEKRDLELKSREKDSKDKLLKQNSNLKEKLQLLTNYYRKSQARMNNCPTCADMEDIDVHSGHQKESKAKSNPTSKIKERKLIVECPSTK